MLRQLLGYMVLIHRARSEDDALPRLESINIYFARFGKVWSMPTELILSHPTYTATEASFVSLARGRAPFKRASSSRKSLGQVAQNSAWL